MTQRWKNRGRDAASDLFHRWLRRLYGQTDALSFARAPAARCGNHRAQEHTSERPHVPLELGPTRALLRFPKQSRQHSRHTQARCTSFRGAPRPRASNDSIHRLREWTSATSRGDFGRSRERSNATRTRSAAFSRNTSRDSFPIRAHVGRRRSSRRSRSRRRRVAFSVQEWSRLGE